MFTYVCLGANDGSRAVRFYDPVLGALGLRRCDVSGELDWEEWAGWGTYRDKGAAEIALWGCKPFDRQPATHGNGVMAAVCRGYTEPQ